MIGRLVTKCAATTSLFLLFSIGAPSAFADLIVEVQDSVAAPGTSSFFDVFISNPDASAVDIGGFSIDLSVPATSGVLFMSVTTSPTSEPYIFAGTGVVDFLASPFSSATFPNTSFIAADLAFLTLGETLDPGEKLSLGRVVYDLSSTVSLGTEVTVSLGPFTDLSDPFGFPISFTSESGTITAIPDPASVPEPTSLAMWAGLGVMGLFAARRKRKTAWSTVTTQTTPKPPAGGFCCLSASVIRPPPSQASHPR